MNRISRVVGSLLLAASGGHIHAFAPRATWNPKPSVTSKSAPTPTLLFSSSNEPPTFYNDFEGFDDDDDDEGYIDTNQLGDWRAFRKSLGGDTRVKSVSKENEDVLRAQSKALADEYATEVWAHATATPEVGGFLARMPLEVEIYRNHKHSIMGKKLRRQYKDVGEASMFWYRNAKQLVEEEMQRIAETAQDGQLDSSELDDESSEMLQLYLDNQDTWQEICLVTSRDESSGTGTSLVLNRPMAFQLTENLAQLVLQGGLGGRSPASSMKQLQAFIKAFGSECAVYVGGPDCQEEPATLIHGFANLPGCEEIMPGIYKGGIQAAIEGVAAGLYKALDFRFFVGRHEYEDSMMDLDVVLGKYQPIAGARTLALKQCISLPKPLWHEVLELCGGELKEISELEKLKRDDLAFQFVDDEDDDSDLEILDELGELFVEFVDDDDDDDGDDMLNFLN